MPADEQQLLFENTARAMGDAELFIKQRHVRNWLQSRPSLRNRRSKGIGYLY